MSDKSPVYGPLSESLAKVAFSQPAVYADNVAISEKDGIFRIAVMEESAPGVMEFRGAVAVSTSLADQIAQMLTSMVAKVEARNG